MVFCYAHNSLRDSQGTAQRSTYKDSSGWFRAHLAVLLSELYSAVVNWVYLSLWASMAAQIWLHHSRSTDCYLARVTNYWLPTSSRSAYTLFMHRTAAWRDGAFKESESLPIILFKVSPLTVFCVWDGSPHLPVTPARLMKSSIGWTVWWTSRPFLMVRWLFRDNG